MDENQKDKEKFLFCDCPCPFCENEIVCSVSQKTFLGTIEFPKCDCGAKYGICIYDGKMDLLNWLRREVCIDNRTEQILHEFCERSWARQGGRKIRIEYLFIFVKAFKGGDDL